MEMVLIRLKWNVNILSVFTMEKWQYTCNRCKEKGGGVGGIPESQSEELHGVP